MAKKDEHGLTQQWREFADYLIADPDMNQTAAYMKAYPKCKSENAAKVNASKLMDRPEVETYLAKRKIERIERIEITQDGVLATLKEYVAITMGKKEYPTVVMIDDMPLEVMTKKFDSAGAGKGIDMMMKHVGGYQETPQVQVNVIQQLLDEIDGSTTGLPAGSEHAEE